jgi:hypothetical protein
MVVECKIVNLFHVFLAFFWFSLKKSSSEQKIRGMSYVKDRFFFIDSLLQKYLINYEIS